MEYNYYKILGVGRSASTNELKLAFRSKAKKYHPDKNQDGDAHAYFQVLNEAYQTLSDPIRRYSYDQKLNWRPGKEEGRKKPKDTDEIREARRERRKRNAEYSASVHRAPEMWEPPVWVKAFFYLVGLAFGGFTIWYSMMYILDGQWNPVMVWVPFLGFLVCLDAASGLITGQPALSVRLFNRIKSGSH